MAKGRSPVQRLIDNAQRRIRHLNEKLRSDKYDEIDRVGFERNKKNIEQFIKDVRKENSKGTLDINEKAMELKENTNLSANEKKIRKNTKKMIYGEGDEVWEQIGENPEYNDLFSEYADLSSQYIGTYGQEAPRNAAYNLIDKIDEKIMDLSNKNELTPEQMSRLNMMKNEIEARLKERGRGKGMLHPLN